MSLPPRSSKGGRPTKETAARLGEHILEAALQEFIAKGFEAAHMEAIANASQVSKRTLYARYRSKEELLRASLDYAVSQHLFQFRSSPTCGDVRQRLATTARGILEVSLSPTGRGIASLLTWLAHHRPHLREQVRNRTTGDAANILREILEEGAANGEIEVADFCFISRIIFDFLVTGPHHQIVSGTAPDLLARENAWFDQALDFIMLALRTRAPTGCSSARSEKRI